MMENQDIFKAEDVPLSIEHNGITLAGWAKPLLTSCRDGVCYEFDVVLNDERLGTIYKGNEAQWTLQNIVDSELVNKIGEQISLWYNT